MDITEKIEQKINETPESFASKFGLPKAVPWIIEQYIKGYKSIKDFQDIVLWANAHNPNLSEYDFTSALREAKKYINSTKDKKFDPYSEILSKHIVLKFDDGKSWIMIGPEDCEAVINRLQYDCSRELKPVYEKKAKCWALQDTKGNILCIYIKGKNKYGTVINQFNNDKIYYHKEIKSLCVQNGFDLVPEAYSESTLAKAIASKELNLDEVPDLRRTLNRLTSTNFANLKLTKYIHYLTLSKAYAVYRITNNIEILKYILLSLLSLNLTKGEIYTVVLNEIQKFPELIDYFRSIRSQDNRTYVKEMYKQIEKLSNI